MLGLRNSLSTSSYVGGFENNYSLEFDAADSLVQCGTLNTYLRNVQKFTISMWIYQDNLTSSGQNGLWGKHQNDYHRTYSFINNTGKVYFGGGLYHGDSFGHWYPSGVSKQYEQNDFVASDGSNPDFSDDGDSINLGYSRSLSQGAGDRYFTNNNAIKSFSALIIPSEKPKHNPYIRSVDIEARMPHVSSGVKTFTFNTTVPHFKDGYDKVLENLIKFSGE